MPGPELDRADPETALEAALPEPELALLEPMTMPESASASEQEVEPALAQPGAAAVAPILAGAGEPAAEKKRGWWRK